MDRQKILITGGTGFVGGPLQEELTRRGIEYYIFPKSRYDLTIKEQAEAVFAAHQDAGVIIHLASYQAAADFPGKHPAEQFYVNNLIHLNVLEGWRKLTPHAKLIAIGCSCGYPSSASTMTEDDFLDGDIHGSVYSYGFTKRLLFMGIRAFNDQYRLNGSYVIPATLYGEHDDFHIETAHVCGALIGKFVKAVREGDATVEIWGDGSQVRDFIYVQDFVLALLHLIPLCDRDIVNVGPGIGTPIRELAEAIRQDTGFSGKVVYDSTRYVGAEKKVMDCTKLATKYGWTVSADLTDGIHKTVQWYRRSYAALKNKRKFADTLSSIC